mgnify:CR=1 FL=1
MDGYVSINRQWKDGDKVRIELPMKLEIVPLNEATHYLALKYGLLFWQLELVTSIYRKMIQICTFYCCYERLSSDRCAGFYRGYPENTAAVIRKKERSWLFCVVRIM